MSFKLIQADQTILSNVELIMTAPDPVDGWPGDTKRSTNIRNINQRNMAQQFTTHASIKKGLKDAGIDPKKAGLSPPINTGAGTGNTIPLQFPPRIKGNSKAMNWRVEDTQSYEPIATLVGAKETKLNLELMYVVTGGAWGVEAISKAVRTIKAYFYRTVEAGRNNNAPLIQIKLYEIAPESGKKSTWRMNSCDISQTDELIIDNGKVFPQVTTVSMDLSMVTQIGNKDGKVLRQPGYSVAPKKPKKEWY